METGGAVIASSGSIEAVGTRFVGNSADADAGALHVLGNSNASLTDCSLEQNSAYTGGAVFVSANSSLTMLRGAAHNNSATVGGAIAGSAAATLQLQAVSLTRNSATVGGAVAAYAADVTLNLTRAADNAAAAGADSASTVDFGVPVMAGVGGALYLRSSTLTALNCTLSRNSAHQHGGALYLERTALAELRHSQLAGNRAGGRGGAIKVANALPKMRASDNHYLNNSATSGGAWAAAAEDLPADLFLREELFAGNEATSGDGGAVAVTGGFLAEMQEQLQQHLP